MIHRSSLRSLGAPAALLSLLGLGFMGPTTCFEPARPLSSPVHPASLSLNMKKSIATSDDGGVHATWHAVTHEGVAVFYARSPDGGGDWEAPRRLSELGPIEPHPAIRASGRSVYVAWHAAGPDGQSVVFRRSIDGGTSFEAPLALTTSGSAAHASLAAYGPNVQVVWADDRSGVSEVYVRSSVDGGQSFEPEQMLSDPLHASWVPSVDAWGPVVVVAWVDYQDGNEEEYVRASRDAGSSWLPARRVTHHPADSWAPSVAVRGETIFLGFFDRRAAGLLDGDVETVLDHAMAILGLPVVPAPPRDPAHYYLDDFHARISAKQHAIATRLPGFVAEGGDPTPVAALMEEFARRMHAWSSGWGIFFVRSPDLGASWEPVRPIATPGGPALRPSLAVDGSDLHVVWFDGRHGDSEIYYRGSTDLGNRFGPEQRLTRSAADSLRPSVDAQDGRVHVLWTDARDGLPRIYAKRGRLLDAAGHE